MPASPFKRPLRWYFKLTHVLSSAPPMLAIRETFIGLLPFYLVSSALEFWQLVFGGAASNPVLRFVDPLFSQMQGSLALFFPSLVCLGLAYNLAKYRNTDALYTGALAVFCLHLSVLVLRERHSADFVLKTVGVAGLVTPFVVAHTLDFARRHGFGQSHGAGLSPLLTRSLDLILPSVVTVAMAQAVVLGIGAALASLQHSGNLLAHLPTVVQGAVHVLVAHLLWFVGLHGENLYDLVIGRDVLSASVAPGFTVASLLSTFVTMGGCGSTLALLLAMAVNGKVGAVGRISAPLQCFNINEIMVYGHPIVFNAYLVLPFVLFPVLAFVLSYGVIAAGLVPVQANVHWMMPPGFNAWVAGGGNPLTVCFQIMMLGLGALVYAPFLRLEERESLVHKLEKLFSEEARPQWDMAHASEMRYALNHQKRLAVQAEVMAAIDLISSGRMCLWYQPLIDVSSQRVYGFEALLRVVMPDGSVAGPAFLGKLEAAGYSDALNSWVIRQACDDLARWQAQGFAPMVSLNVTANFLSDPAQVQQMIERVRGCVRQVRLEILERSLADNFAEAQANAGRLQRAGILLSVDDFGSGYSNFALLSKLAVQTIKLDGSLLEQAGGRAGRQLYQDLCALMKRQAYVLVAEGVETPELAQFVIACGVDVMQGWCFAKAMAPADAMAYARARGMLETPLDSAPVPLAPSLAYF